MAIYIFIKKQNRYMEMVTKKYTGKAYAYEMPDVIVIDEFLSGLLSSEIRNIVFLYDKEQNQHSKNFIKCENDGKLSSIAITDGGAWYLILKQ